MITKTLLLITLLLTISIYLIKHVIPRENIIVDEHTSVRFSDSLVDYHGYTYEGVKDGYHTYTKYEKRYKWNKFNWNEIEFNLFIFRDLLFGLSIVFILIYIASTISYTQKVDALDYQKEYVAELNQEVETIVNSFIKHEELTFDCDVSLEALVITYPELRSVELVHEQIKVLRDEKAKLNKLELDIIKYKTTKKFIGLGFKNE